SMCLYFRKLIPVFFTLLLFANSVVAKVTPGRYGLPAFSDSVHLIIDIKTAASTDSVLKAQPQLSNTNSINGMATEQKFTDKTADFYLVLFLFVVLGFIRVTDPKYFQSLWQAFKNPSTSSRQLREKLQNASVPNLLMNIFFTMSAAAYAYYVVRNFMPQRSGNIAPSLLLLMLIGGMVAIYLGKYAVIKFSGWSFRVESITEHYLFNVFLVNKILAIILLPFIVLLAFATPVIAQPALIVSFILTLVLFVNRYLRSWQVFGSFFQYSKFHFFTYLCASELLPLAVLMKLLVRGLLY
ncbi:MAG TPA: DUF4271 domain-containing protein, partial [Flavipsychrobacter sp.]|nr:DUF4271 domain-containing protein [Flavipsychrobacter sp.]